jgi:hypothetical protein
MSGINHYAISKILGSEMRPARGTRFGGFGILEATAETLKTLRQADHELAARKFTLDDDRLVASAFEAVRNGASPDALLWDTDLAAGFVARCGELGLAYPPASLVRRVIHIRKSPATYARHGIRLSPTTRSEPHPSIVPQYAHVIEFALVRLRYRHGASIDTILADPELAREFETLALEVAPGLTGEQLRLGALYIRKTRHISKGDAEKAQALNPTQVEQAMSESVSLASVNTGEVPSAPGLLELREGDRYLYVARNDNLRPAVEQLRTGRAFSVVANGFWQPALETITLRYVAGRKVGGVPTTRWELRLIQAREPIFNWPMTKKREAA